MLQYIFDTPKYTINKRGNSFYFVGLERQHSTIPKKSFERALKSWNLLIGQMLQQNGQKIFYPRGFIDHTFIKIF